MKVSNQSSGNKLHKRKFGRDLTNTSILSKHQHKKPNEDQNMEDEGRSKMENGQQIIKYKSLNDYAEYIEQYTVSQSYLKGIHISYMECQNQINSRMRQILVGWMVFVHDHFGLKEETLYFSVMMMDRYSNKEKVEKSKYKLLGITCLFIAAKYLQMKIPKLKSYVRACEDSVKDQQILEMETQIITSLSFQLGNQTLTYELLVNRLACVIGDEELRQNIQRITQYILTLSLIEYDFCLMNSSYLSAVIIYIGCKMKQVKEINSKYIIGRYRLSQAIFKEYFHKIVQLYNQRNSAKFQVVNKKYNIVIKNCES